MLEHNINKNDFLNNVVPCPQDRWDMETGNQSEVPEQIRSGTSLEDEDDLDSKGSIEPGD